MTEAPNGSPVEAQATPGEEQAVLIPEAEKPKAVNAPPDIAEQLAAIRRSTERTEEALFPNHPFWKKAQMAISNSVGGVLLWGATTGIVGGYITMKVNEVDTCIDGVTQQYAEKKDQDKKPDDKIPAAKEKLDQCKTQLECVKASAEIQRLYAEAGLAEAKAAREEGRKAREQLESQTKCTSKVIPKSTQDFKDDMVHLKNKALSLL